MSSHELKGESGKDEKESSKMDCDMNSLPSSSKENLLDASFLQAPELSSETEESKKSHCEASATFMDTFQPGCEPLGSAMELNKVIYKTTEGVQDVAEFFSGPTSSSSHPSKKLHDSKQSTPQTKEDDCPTSTTKIKHRNEKNPNSSRPIKFKDFALKPSDLPFTKEKLAGTLTLEEACGFLPSLMKSKRGDLSSKEKQLDQISVDLQRALLEAKTLCISMENVPDNVPSDISAARVQVQKLMYQLSSSYRVFEKLDQLGKSLKEGIEEYSKQTGDYHSSIDALLEYILQNILEKCLQARANQ